MRSGGLLLALAGGLVSPVAAQDTPARVRITFLDVGQGDAIVIRAPAGEVAMIDAGAGSPLRELQRLGVEEVDLLVATHPHRDHIGGIDAVLTARPVGYYLDNGAATGGDLLAQVTASVDNLGVTRLGPSARTIRLGAVTLEIFPPSETAVATGAESVGVLLTFGEFTAFFSGDADREQLDHWADRQAFSELTLLKAPHHGSVTGLSRTFVERSAPEVVVVSVGSDNVLGHPRPEALAVYGSYADQLLRTDRDGHVTVFGHADGGYEVALGERLLPPTQAPLVGDGSTVALHVESGARGGSAPRDLNAQYLVVENRSPSNMPIGRWQVCDLSTRCFRFPDDAVVRAGLRVVVHTGLGMPDGVSFFMNHDRSVWNPDGDEATLFDENGVEVARTVYGPRGEAPGR